jgi:hypothetical protein
VRDNPTDTRAAQTTRRSALAAVAAVSTGCLEAVPLSTRHPTTVSVYNPASQPREASIVVSDGDATLLDTELTVPPRATAHLPERILTEQTVAVAVQWNETTVAHEWEVKSSVEIPLDDDAPLRTVTRDDPLRGYRDDGRVDVRLNGNEGQTGAVRVTRDEKVGFETEWTLSNSKGVTYHDRLDGTGESVVTAQRGAAEASRRVSLSGVVQVVADIKQMGIEVDDADNETLSQ